MGMTLQQILALDLVVRRYVEDQAASGPADVACALGWPTHKAGRILAKLSRELGLLDRYRGPCVRHSGSEWTYTPSKCHLTALLRANCASLDWETHRRHVDGVSR